MKEEPDKIGKKKKKKSTKFKNSPLIIFICVVLDSLCNLYNWRYKNLGNLPHVQLMPEFRTANAGFLYDFQLINVEDFNGVGESEPNPYFYQVREIVDSVFNLDMAY